METFTLEVFHRVKDVNLTIKFHLFTDEVRSTEEAALTGSVGTVYNDGMLSVFAFVHFIEQTEESNTRPWFLIVHLPRLELILRDKARFNARLSGVG